MDRRPSKPDKTGTALKRGEIDPSELDLTAPKRKRRKKRKLPEPRDELKASKEDLLKRAQSRNFPPQVIMEPAGVDQEHWTSPHNDEELWWLQLADAFGTRSYAVMIFFLEQIEKLCGRNVWDEESYQWRLDEATFSAILAIVSTAKPENEIEAALAAQMAAVHVMQMKASARAIRYDTDVQTAAVAAKLAKTFTEQIETLEMLKGREKISRQSIKVTKETHQHVHYHDHRGQAKITGQPHEPETSRSPQIADDREALRSQDQSRDALPLPRSKGKG